MPASPDANAPPVCVTGRSALQELAWELAGKLSDAAPAVPHRPEGRGGGGEGESMHEAWEHLKHDVQDPADWDQRTEREFHEMEAHRRAAQRWGRMQAAPPASLYKSSNLNLW